MRRNNEGAAAAGFVGWKVIDVYRPSLKPKVLPNATMSRDILRPIDIYHDPDIIGFNQDKCVTMCVHYRLSTNVAL